LEKDGTEGRLDTINRLEKGEQIVDTRC